MRLPNLRHLQTFRVLMHSQSVTEAARQLNVTQPAVSKAIAMLEADLGTKLFRRVRGRLYPSAGATRFLSEVEQLFTQLEAVAAGIEDLRADQDRQLSISTIPTLASSIVGISLGHFAREHPTIRTRLFSENHLQVINQVSLRQVDLGFTYGMPSVGQALSTELIAEFEVVCVLNKANPLARQLVLTPKALQQSPLILWEQQSPTGRLVREAFSKAGVVPDSRVETNSSSAANLLATIAAGVAIIDPTIVKAHPGKDIVMRRFRPRIPLQLVCIQSLYHPATSLSKKFLEYLRSAVSTADAKLPSARRRESRAE